ncbi:MAG TPA: peptidylprolyl isomerase [Acidobacteriota bacterium]|nr:peptidylprolyl isomerase [Acidobacteriota bacterium]
MKKFMILIVILSLFFPTCSAKKEEVVLKKGTSTYELAKDLSQIVETLDPDINKVLVSSQNFNLTTGEIIQFMEENLGSKAEQLKQMNAENLKQYVQRNASVLADRKLLLAEVRDSDVSITKQEVDQVINAQAEKAGGMDKFREMLNSNGITLEIFRGNIQKEMLIQSFLDQKIGSEVTVKDEEILSAYNSPKTVTVRHILLLTQDKDEAEKKAVLEKMKQIQKRAQAGEDFTELAKEFSEDSGSQEKGGLYENIERGVMVKPFEEAAFNVPVGEISDIVETQYGYHIIKVEERQMEERPLDQVRDEIRQNIRQTRIEQEFSRYMDELRSQANIQSFEL